MVGMTMASESDTPGLGDPARWRYGASEVGTLLGDD
jgi:hypothetical protein